MEERIPILHYLNNKNQLTLIKTEKISKELYINYKNECFELIDLILSEKYKRVIIIRKKQKMKKKHKIYIVKESSFPLIDSFIENLVNERFENLKLIDYYYDEVINNDDNNLLNILDQERKKRMEGKTKLNNDNNINNNKIKISKDYNIIYSDDYSNPLIEEFNQNSEIYSKDFITKMNIFHDDN